MTNTTVLANSLAGRESAGVCHCFPAVVSGEVSNCSASCESAENASSRWRWLSSSGIDCGASRGVTISRLVERSLERRTALGRRLIALRERAIAAGLRLLSDDEVLVEVKRRRGEVEGDETNLS